MSVVRATTIVVAFSGFFSALSGEVFAQESCGNIVGEESGAEYIIPIEDCDNPFGPVNLNPHLAVSFGDTPVTDGATYPFLNSTHTFVLTGTHPDMFMSGYKAYFHEGINYRVVGEGAIDVPFTFTRPGTYSLALYEDAELILSSSVWKKFFATVVPTAYAFPGISRVITFEVEPEEELTGVSNILFLPGMQGSRLYMNEGDTEEQLWEPFGSQDYENLRMTDAGESINDIYTRDVIDSIYVGGIGGDVYSSFIDFLEELDGENGPLVQLFPYDWRYSIADILENGTQYETGLSKKLVETVNYLATLSKTHKVTIIAHSNGGLLAKALMTKLEELGKQDQVDKIIFIASPHIGTPKAIAALLHGYDQEQALNIPADARDIRKVIKNMPGPHGLLPSEAYVGTLTEPLISFDNSSTTRPFRDRYGYTVNTVSEYIDFLNGAEGRVEDLENIALPTKANSTHLEEALAYHALVLDTWQAPDGVEVFNVVGTGIETPKSIEYREFVDDYCGSPVCVMRKIEPVVKFTRRGDETVVLDSANGVNADTLVHVNLFEANRGISVNRVHADITELESVQTLVDAVLHGSSTDDIEHISSTEPAVDSESVRIDRIHSPARIYIEDAQGRRTGRDSAGNEWKEEIPGTSYYEIGGVKYILKSGNLNHKVVIEGEGSGVFTHGVDELMDEEQTTLHTLIATVTPTTRVTYEYTNGTTGPVSIDQNGDGVTDYHVTLDGALIETKATYPELRTAIRNLKLPRLKEVLLLSIADQAEQFYKKRNDPKLGRTYERLEEGALYLLDQTLIQLRKAKIITTDAYQGIKSIIDKLIKQ